jgi:hypothetical protein
VGGSKAKTIYRSSFEICHLSFGGAVGVEYATRPEIMNEEKITNDE